MRPLRLENALFPKKSKEETSLEQAIDKLHSQMDEFLGNEQEYAVMVDQLTKLYQLREHESRWKVSPDTLVLVAGNLAGILMIVAYERSNIVTSKAINFITKLK